MTAKEITRAEINAFLRSAIILAMAKPEYINGGVRVRDVTLTAEGYVRLNIDNGDILYLDFEHLVPRDKPEPRIADAFYGAQCPSYPFCSGGCGLGCTHEIVSKRRATKGSPGRACGPEAIQPAQICAGSERPTA